MDGRRYLLPVSLGLFVVWMVVETVLAPASYAMKFAAEAALCVPVILVVRKVQRPTSRSVDAPAVRRAHVPGWRRVSDGGCRAGGPDGGGAAISRRLSVLDRRVLLVLVPAAVVGGLTLWYVLQAGAGQADGAAAVLAGDSMLAEPASDLVGDVLAEPAFDLVGDDLAEPAFDLVGAGLAEPAFDLRGLGIILRLLILALIAVTTAILEEGIMRVALFEALADVARSGAAPDAALGSVGSFAEDDASRSGREAASRRSRDVEGVLASGDVDVRVALGIAAIFGILHAGSGGLGADAAGSFASSSGAVVSAFAGSGYLAPYLIPFLRVIAAFAFSLVMTSIWLSGRDGRRFGWMVVLHAAYDFLAFAPAALVSGLVFVGPPTGGLIGIGIAAAPAVFLAPLAWRLWHRPVDVGTR